jgi:hypothetical protein
MTKARTLKEVVVGFLMTFDRERDSTEQGYRDLLNELAEAGFVIAPTEASPGMLAVADATALLECTEDIADRSETRRREEFATAYRAMVTAAQTSVEAA